MMDRTDEGSPYICQQVDFIIDQVGYTSQLGVDTPLQSQDYRIHLATKVNIAR